MSVVSLLFRKDLRRCLAPLVLWLGCLLGAEYWIRLKTGVTEDETILRTMLLGFLVQGHTLYSFLVCFGLLQEDRPENAWWRTRPISPGQLFLAKVAVSLVTTFLPLAIALLGASLMGYSVAPFVLVIVFVMVGICPFLVICLAFGLFSLLRNRSAALFAAIGMGIVAMLLLPKSDPSRPYCTLLLPIVLGCAVMLTGLCSGYLAFRHGRGLRAARPFLIGYGLMLVSFLAVRPFL